MPLIKVTDLVYGRLRAPDLDVVEELLTPFGMVRSARTPNALSMEALRSQWGEGAPEKFIRHVSA